MEMSAELEDDLFFADLSKQISLLIMDDDDDEDPLANYPSVSRQAFSHAIHHPPVQAQFVYGQSCTRESKGTGVFIPQSTHPRTNRQRQSRFSNNNNKKSQRQQLVHDNTKMVVSQQVQVVASNGSFKSKYARA